jgi:hypothetical protein
MGTTQPNSWMMGEMKSIDCAPAKIYIWILLLLFEWIVECIIIIHIYIYINSELNLRYCQRFFMAEHFFFPFWLCSPLVLSPFFFIVGGVQRWNCSSLSTLRPKSHWIDRIQVWQRASNRHFDKWHFTPTPGKIISKKKKVPLLGCIRWLLQPKCIVCKNLVAGHLVMYNSAFAIHVRIVFFFRELFLSQSLKDISSLCDVSPLSYLSRGTTFSLFSQCKSLSSICYKVMSPLFRHGPMQTPPFKLHYPATGRPKAESFLGNSERRFSLCPERPQCSQSCRARTLQQHRTSLDAETRIVHLFRLYTNPWQKREREKPELNGLLAFLKIFHGFAVAFFLIHARLCVRVYTSPESADLNGRCCVYNKYTKSILYIAGRFSIQLNIFLASQIRKSDENNVTT